MKSWVGLFILALQVTISCFLWKCLQVHLELYYAQTKDVESLMYKVYIYMNIVSMNTHHISPL